MPGAVLPAKHVHLVFIDDRAVVLTRRRRGALLDQHCIPLHQLCMCVTISHHHFEKTSPHTPTTAHDMKRTKVEAVEVIPIHAIVTAKDVHLVLLVHDGAVAETGRWRLASSHQLLPIARHCSTPTSKCVVMRRENEEERTEKNEEERKANRSHRPEGR